MRAEVAGGKEDLVFLHDAFDTGRERLSTSGRLQLRLRYGDDRRWAILLAEQPVTGDLFDPPAPRAVLTNVDLSLVASGGTDATISVTETFEARRGPVSTLLLDLLDTAESQSGSSVLRTELFGSVRRGRDRIEERPVRVTGVFDEAGRPLPFDHRNDRIAVALGGPVASGKSVRVRFEIEGGLLVHPLGNDYWILGTGPWFPLPGLAAQAFTARMTVRVKKPFRPLASGTTVRRAEEGDFNLLETRFDHPVPFLTSSRGTTPGTRRRETASPFGSPPTADGTPPRRGASATSRSRRSASTRSSSGRFRLAS